MDDWVGSKRVNKKMRMDEDEEDEDVDYTSLGD